MKVAASTLAELESPGFRPLATAQCGNFTCAANGTASSLTGFVVLLLLLPSRSTKKKGAGTERRLPSKKGSKWHAVAAGDRSFTSRVSGSSAFAPEQISRPPASLSGSPTRVTSSRMSRHRHSPIHKSLKSQKRTLLGPAHAGCARTFAGAGIANTCATRRCICQEDSSKPNAKQAQRRASLTRPLPQFSIVRFG